MNEDTVLPFTGTDTISISDIDDFGNDLEVTLSVSNGTLDLGTTTGLTFTTGDGTDDATVTFTGTEADINAALSTLTYQGNPDYNGSDTLDISVNDLGNIAILNGS